jgi:hypothetical protein
MRQDAFKPRSLPSMKPLSRLMLGAATAATLIAASAPVSAQRWVYGGGPRYYHYHHGGGSGLAGFLAGALVVGGIAAVASSSSRSDAYTQGYVDGRRIDSDWGWGYRYGTGEQGAAVDRCAYAAGREGQRYAQDAMVTDIDVVERVADGYVVRGLIDVRHDYGGGYSREGYTDHSRFSCSFRYGQVDRVWIDEGRARPLND